ncbi:MAG TPA: hypothetical protein VFE91_06095 [Nitrososphaerales archaeon]|nr:hypothetical protein [Nitrososphaerales archaeon]
MTEFDAMGIIGGQFTMKANNNRFVRLFRQAVTRPPETVPRITTLRLVQLSGRKTHYTVGLTKYSERHGSAAEARQTITFYAKLLAQVSDPAATGVIAHELSHAWLNEHVRPEQSRGREEEADRLARSWGFGTEMDALDLEAETVA